MRHFTKACCIVILLIAACQDQPKPEPMYTLFIGTYTDGDSEGIYKYTFNATDGSLTQDTLAARLTNPSYLTISNDGKNLYAVQETADFDSLGGGVTAFALDDGILSELNSLGSNGAHPCHITLSGNGKLAVSNYTGGNVSIYSLNQTGALNDNPQVIDHKPMDSVKTSHAHMAQFVDNELFISDLGLDAVMRYSSDTSEFIPSAQNSLALSDGAGPRHFTLNEDRSVLYVINEYNASIVVFKKDADGNYQSVQTVRTLDANYTENNSCADIHLSPDGKFLYGSNRGENTVVIFSVDMDTGLLTLVGRSSVQGEWPRNFSLDPTGQFLLVANQYSNNITIFRRDSETGQLEFLSEAKIVNPVCLKFL